MEAGVCGRAAQVCGMVRKTAVERNRFAVGLAAVSRAAPRAFRAFPPPPLNRAAPARYPRFERTSDRDRVSSLSFVQQAHQIAPLSQLFNFHKSKSRTTRFHSTGCMGKCPQQPLGAAMVCPGTSPYNPLRLQQIALDGSNFSGVLGPDATGLNGHSPGERVTISSREIADWMFVENEKLVGASACGPSANGCPGRLEGSLRRACGSGSSSRRTATAQRVFYSWRGQSGVGRCRDVKRLS
jgi:Uncharacterized protein conserved in bacteria (DUF2314)